MATEDSPLSQEVLAAVSAYKFYRTPYDDTLIVRAYCRASHARSQITRSRSHAYLRYMYPVHFPFCAAFGPSKLRRPSTAPSAQLPISRPRLARQQSFRHWANGARCRDVLGGEPQTFPSNACLGAVPGTVGTGGHEGGIRVMITCCWWVCGSFFLSSFLSSLILALRRV